MTTSASPPVFNLNLNELIEEAFERAGAELRTGYEFRTARRSLNLMFAEWANRGINLWTVESDSVALVQGQAINRTSRFRVLAFRPTPACLTRLRRAVRSKSTLTA